MGSWSECSIECKTGDNDIAGNQTRSVECTLQDGTAVSDSFCPEDDNNLRPAVSRSCHDYVCNATSTMPDVDGTMLQHGSHLFRLIIALIVFVLLMI